MKSIADLKKEAARTWQRNIAEWLADPSAACFERGFGRLTEREAMANLEATRRAFAEVTEAERLPGVEVTRSSVAWRDLGKQRVPERMRVTGLSEIAAFAGISREVQLLLRRTAELAALCGQLWQEAADAAPTAMAAASASSLQDGELEGEHEGEGTVDANVPAPSPREAAARTIAANRARLTQLPADDWQRLLAMASWIARHPESGLRPRSLPVAGLDTKWLRSNTGLVRALAAVLRRGPIAENLGLRVDVLPQVQLRLPEELAVVAQSGARLRCLTLDLLALGRLFSSPPAARVLIVENLETFLSLPELPGTICVFGSGKQVLALARVPWLRQLPVRYWGDLDEHGFEILAGLRRACHAEEAATSAGQGSSSDLSAELVMRRISSLLMDSGTLQAHSLLIVPGAVASAVDEGWLTAEELAALTLLRQGFGLAARQGASRLEQERIAWDWALERLLSS